MVRQTEKIELGKLRFNILYLNRPGRYGPVGESSRSNDSRIRLGTREDIEISTSFMIDRSKNVVGPCQNAADMHRLATSIVTGRKNPSGLALCYGVR